MKAVIQRVNNARLYADGKLISQIGKGLTVFLCVERGDSVSVCETFADKLSKLHIFADGVGKMNLSVLDVQGETLLVSQFTLAADMSRGNRPNFSEAETPARAKELYELVARLLTENGVKVQTGVFGADMTIDRQDDGPVTLIWESKR